MSKEIIYKLKFREDGKECIIDIFITFSSRGILRDYDKLQAKRNEFLSIYLKYKEFDYLIKDYKEEKPENWKEEIKKLKNEMSQVEEELTNYDYDSFVVDEMKIIRMLLKDNLIDDQRLYESDFWDYKVDPAIIKDFLETSIYKDLDSDLKKKLLEVE